ncbi:MAG TPA: PhaM family polyhydroxyalkanoate granule multifunctional regulatory protein [Burkholderiaceae bacterium]|jgi:hypothetical protein|nr:PhaM family polyhydroxyalkanoate granule multifunctional regulatory protein [Burkholderiaceae bacterium]
MRDNDRLSLAGSFADGLEMMRKFWGAAGVSMPAELSATMPGLPSMLVPTLDIGELDKRIADLRAVEQWLAANANMLRASIQTLEVQRNTIATLQTLGDTMLKPAGGGAPRADAPASGVPPAPAPAVANKAPRRARRSKPDAAPAPTAAPLDPTAWWSALQDQFTRIAAAAAAPSGFAAAKPVRSRRARKRAPAA